MCITHVSSLNVRVHVSQKISKVISDWPLTSQISLFCLVKQKRFDIRLRVTYGLVPFIHPTFSMVINPFTARVFDGVL